MDSTASSSSSRQTAPHPSSSSQNDSSKIKRPMNCFMLYRRDMINEGMQARDIPLTWKSMPADHPVKKEYEEMAAQVALEHKVLYPEYKYEPTKKVRTVMTVKQVVMGVKDETAEEEEKRRRKNERQNEIRRGKRRAEIKAQHTQNFGQSGSQSQSSDVGVDAAPPSSYEPDALIDNEIEASQLFRPSDFMSVTTTSGIVKSKHRRIYEVVHIEGATLLEERPYMGKERKTGYLSQLDGYYGSIYKRYDIPENCDEVPYGPYDDRTLLTDEPTDYQQEQTFEEDIAYDREFYQLELKRLFGTSLSW